MCVQYAPRNVHPVAVFKVNASYGTQTGVALPVAVPFATVYRVALVSLNLLWMPGHISVQTNWLAVSSTGPLLFSVGCMSERRYKSPTPNPHDLMLN